MTSTSNEPTTSTPDKNIIRYPLKNDYMFRAVFQSRPKALEGLCRSLLRLSPSDSIHIDLKNPIQLGAAIDNKELQPEPRHTIQRRPPCTAYRLS